MSGSALLMAAKRWDHARVADLLARSPELIAATDARGRHPLHLCAGVPLDRASAGVASAIATVERLVACGAAIDRAHGIPEHGRVLRATPLWYALARGRNGRLARHLLDRGARPDGCLHTVIWSHDLDMLALLLRHGADANQVVGTESPLHYAVRLGRDGAVLALIAAGADTTAPDVAGWGPRVLAKSRRLSAEAMAALGSRSSAGSLSAAASARWTAPPPSGPPMASPLPGSGMPLDAGQSPAASSPAGATST